MKSIWVTWEIQRRNRGISSGLGWQLFEIVDNRNRLIRYASSIYQTLLILWRKKPYIVGAQNPSIILAILVVVLKPFLRYRVVIDAHNEGIFPLEGKSKFLGIVARWIQKKADLTLITTENFKSIVATNGGTGFVLPDRIPIFRDVHHKKLQGKWNILFICTFSSDEPFEEVLKAARMLSNEVVIYVTGNFTGKVKNKEIPKNIKLLGFIPDMEFVSLLFSADLVMDLTLREHCLVCGAYEGIAASRPLILSNTEALRKYFNKGCIYVDSDPESIADGIRTAIYTYKKLENEVKHLKNELEKSWEERMKKLRSILKINGNDKSGQC